MEKRRQFVRWIFNYIWIFVICVVLAFVAFRFFLSVLNGQINSTLSVASEQLQNFYDTEFEKQQLCIYNALNSQNLSNLPRNFESKDAHLRNNTLKNAIKELSHSFANINTVSECIVIYDNSPAAVSFSGYMRKDTVYDLYFRSNYSDYNKWHTEMFGFEGISKYLRVSEGTASPLMSLYKWKNGSSTALAIIFINTDVLINAVVGDTKAEQIFGIMSQEGKLLLSNSDADITGYREYTGTVKLNGKEYYVASTASTDEKLSYIVLLPEGQYKTKEKLVIGVALICGVLCLILCLFAAYYLSKKEYLPIERIIKKIGAEYTLGEHETSFIEKEIGKIIDDNRRITFNLNQKDIKLREALLTNLVKNQHEMTQQELYEEFGIDLRTSNCVLIMMDILDSGVFHRKEINQIYLVISNVFSELMEKTAQCDYLHIEKRYVCIVNSDDNNILDIAYENLEFLTEFVVENFGIDLKCAVSKQNDFYSLPELYSQALELMKLEDAEWEILMYDEIVEYISEMHRDLDEASQNKRQSEEKIVRIHKYISENFCDPMLNISTVATNFDITLNHLSRSFKQYYGIKPSEYLLDCRVEKAAALLKTTKMNVAGVGEQCGFLNAGMFIRAFKKKYGTTPGMYSKFN